MHVSTTPHAFMAGLAIAGVLALWGASSAFGQGGTADLARYAGADRRERLIAGAKREGVVTVYTSAATDDAAALTAAFEKKHGIKVQVWRSSSENIVQRSVAEARGRRFDADVFETGSIAMESLQRSSCSRRSRHRYSLSLLRRRSRPTVNGSARASTFLPPRTTRGSSSRTKSQGGMTTSSIGAGKESSEWRRRTATGLERS